ncbi:hypothetical protein L218DRAFT_1010776 [Marasmius fiardii PR-910]|nr:hypothetical protein L218DRAFT_1010776 [Marasmius fiardii PR-910]
MGLSRVLPTVPHASFMVGRPMNSVPASDLVYTVPSLTAGATFAVLVHVGLQFNPKYKLQAEF